MVSLDDFKQETECVYKNERYSVRDNGAVLRHNKENKIIRKYDNQWYFGKPNNNGYLLIVSEVVHRIVAFAFLGEPPTTQHVVDHIDTNRHNNRPENLRWVTKLENILINPITLSRIIYNYGSIDNFLSDPSKPLDGVLDQNFAWMRTVSKEESENTKNNLLNWAIDGKLSNGGALGDWFFSKLQISKDPYNEESPLIHSLTPHAIQKNWKTPSEFPCCPQDVMNISISDYFANLQVEKVFSQNQYNNSIIEDFAISTDKSKIWVMCRNSNENAPKKYSLAEITFENNLFVHNSIGSFFKKDGAEKQFTLLQGLEWTGGETFDELC